MNTLDTITLISYIIGLILIIKGILILKPNTDDYKYQRYLYKKSILWVIPGLIIFLMATFIHANKIV